MTRSSARNGCASPWRWRTRVRRPGSSTHPVKAVLERAGVSRLTFYELYDGKLDCFLEALDVVGEVLARPAPARRRRRRPSRRSTEPREPSTGTSTRSSHNLPFARLYIVEVHAAGPVGAHPSSRAADAGRRSRRRPVRRRGRRGAVRLRGLRRRRVGPRHAARGDRRRRSDPRPPRSARVARCAAPFSRDPVGLGRTSHSVVSVRP